jgi:peptidoglycan L-alanyl-D-glutamate endopeptidase CwlK
MRFAVLLICLTTCSGSRSNGVPPSADKGRDDLRVRSTPAVTERATGRADPPATENAPASVAPPTGMACLRAGYPGIVERAEHDGGRWFAVMADGRRLLWDDGRDKPFEERLGSPDLEDQLAMPYPKGRTKAPPRENDDPGRCRVEAFFKAVYGNTKNAVKANLVSVPWLPKRLGKTLQFNQRNNAAEALSMVSRELDDRLPKSAMRYISQPAGTFNWRHIAGTNRLSAHSFGIAVDINVEGSNYWRWEMNGHPLVCKNRIPLQIVEVFEKHGFIWGGKWYHYDTMHFEYRPELLASACAR